MNLPNKLSLLRIVLAFVFIFFLMIDHLWGKVLALVLFAVAALTDYWDGQIAREQNLVTNLGKLIDPLADKILVIGAFIGFVELGLIPAWMVLVIVAREFCVTGLRLIAAAQGRVLAASRSGKHKTVSQMFAIVAILILLVVREFLFSSSDQALASFDFWLPSIISIAMMITIVFTVISGYLYIYQNMDLFDERS